MSHPIDKFAKQMIGGRNESKTILHRYRFVGYFYCLALLDLTKIKVSFSDTSASTMTVYPVAFFALLGLLLIYHGLKPLWRN